MVHRVTPDLIQHTQYHHRSSISNITPNTLPVRIQAPLTARSSSLRWLSQQPSTTQQNSTPKRAGQNPESIFQEAIYHGTSSRYKWLPQDTKPLRSCSGNRAKMLLKGHLGIKCHSQYNTVIRFLQHSSANSQWEWLGMHCVWPGDSHSLGLTCIQFHSPKGNEIEFDGTIAIKVESSAWLIRSFSRMEKS